MPQVRREDGRCGMKMYYTVYDDRTDDVLAFGNAA
nr:MAG TPA_asm: hypothetical protein [Caudoviricetes sp.]